MNFLEERIVKDGVVKEGNVLKVDSFLNHQMDIELFDEMGAEFKRRFASENINKIVTIEASGIGYHPRPDLRPQRRRSARPYPRYLHPHFHRLQYPHHALRHSCFADFVGGKRKKTPF